MIDRFSTDEISATSSGVVFPVGSAHIAARCSQRDADHLGEAERPVVVWCELELRDERVELIAFSSEGRRQLYRDARRVSGIGVVSAVALLDCGEPIDILRAAVAGEREFFQGVPGLGPKKIALLSDALKRGGGGALPVELPIRVTAWVEARDLVISTLGCDENIAEAALRATSGEDPVELAESAIQAVRERIAR